MKRSLKIIVAFSAIAGMIAFGCKKKEDVEIDNETQSSVDNAVADQEYASIVPTVNNHAINTKGTGAAGKIMASCDTLTWLNRSGSYVFGGVTYAQADTSLIPGTKRYVKPPVYELDLTGTCSQSFTDGKLRSGKWFLVLTGPIKEVGNKMILQLINHKASNITYKCDSLVVTTTTVSPAYSEFNTRLFKGECVSPSWTIKYEFDRNIRHYRNGNPGGTDPVTMLWGSAKGTNRQGRTFTVEIPAGSPLVKHKSCQYIDKGIMGLIPQGFKERTVDFGNGTCDDDATFTVNGNTVAFKLR